MEAELALPDEEFESWLLGRLRLQIKESQDKMEQELKEEFWLKEKQERAT